MDLYLDWKFILILKKAKTNINFGKRIIIKYSLIHKSAELKIKANQWYIILSHWNNGKDIESLHA